MDVPQRFRWEAADELVPPRLAAVAWSHQPNRMATKAGSLPGQNREPDFPD